jgi:Prokaryotic phospholipase A2
MRSPHVAALTLAALALLYAAGSPPSAGAAGGSLRNCGRLDQQGPPSGVKVPKDGFFNRGDATRWQGPATRIRARGIACDQALALLGQWLVNDQFPPTRGGLPEPPGSPPGWSCGPLAGRFVPVRIPDRKVIHCAGPPDPGSPGLGGFFIFRLVRVTPRAMSGRTVVFKDGVGASAQVTWDTSGGTLKYYGTVYDKKRDGRHARIYRVNDRSAPRLIASATRGRHKSFGSSRNPLETSLPAHFRVCTHEQDRQIACSDKFEDADPSSIRRRLRQQADRIMEMDYLTFIRFKREQRPGPFNWSDDGCSGPWGIKRVYRKLFNRPCQQHDFGYRNYGQPKGLKLGRNEDVRGWIDNRFLQEMRQLCIRNWGGFNPQRNTCLTEAQGVWGAVRLGGRDAFYNG